MAAISLWVAEGCLFSGVTTLFDAFSIAELWHRSLSEKENTPLFEIKILTTDGSPVKAYGGIQIQPDGAVNDVKNTDFVVLSPLLPNVVPMPENLDTLYRWIETLRARGVPIATVCTGTFILAEMGLLDGKKATTNWQYARMLQRKYPKVNLKSECMMTEDDGIICTGAATAVYTLGLHIIRKFGYDRLANVVAKALLVDPNRSSQTPYTVLNPLKNHGDSQVLKAQEFIEENFAAIDTIDAIARDVGISPRHFKRRFKKATGDPPLKYLQNIRIDAAKEKLETTRDTIDDITWAIGYKDVSSFCRLFKQYTELSPRAYRDKFFNNAPA